MSFFFFFFFNDTATTDIYTSVHTLSLHDALPISGNVVEPVKVINEWGVDAFRYYVVRELDIGPDGNWTDAGFQSRYQAELANGLGNLVNRSLSMLKRYRTGVVPARSDELAPFVTQTVSQALKQLGENRLQAALQTIWGLVH